MASSITIQGASSSSTSPHPYDVFLSFRGSDTRQNFTAYLCKTLREKGIYTYMDDKLRMGDEIGPKLLEAINESRIAIVVLSENYASSPWCLRELEKILECMETNQQIVMPVFYKVDPSDVRYQNKSFGEALTKHESRYKVSTVEHWKTALQKVADLSGGHLVKENEFEVMDQIVQEVVSRMAKLIPILDVAKYPVGIESRVKQINVLLRIEMNDRRMVGIFGLGGVGKTTIAKAVFNSIAYKFEGKCFLDNVRETSKLRNGLESLQEKLLFEILGDSSLKVHSVDQGVNVIKERLCNKNVLLVLDDVDDLTQLEKLSRECGSFGLGSRIIITTRDEHLLATHGVDLRHKMNDLDDNEALKLFSRHAFHSDKPNDGFVELTKHALRYAGGNPLALSVVGSNLYGKGINHWKSELKKYKENPHTRIYDVLKISYDGLEENEKNIFLDIACFFKGMNAIYVTHILNSCDFYADSGIRVLIDKSLITINFMRALVMHDLLQDMGRKIVHQESPNELGKRSRLWYYEDVRYVLEENVGTENIKGILVDLPEQDLIQWRSNTFENMKRLKCFICRNAEFSEELTYLPIELRVLDWIECPLHSLPSNFHGRKLTILRMRNGLFKGLKEGFQNLPNLSIMELIGLENLTEIPDISRIPNLQELIVFECKNLFKVHDFVGFHDKLTNLSFSSCSNLISLPKSLKLRCLKILCFQRCSRLETFPEIECKMEPNCLFSLTVTDCRNLIHLPSSIFQLQQCKTLRVSGSPKLVMLPTNVRDERQSTEESRDLFLTPPLPNSSISDVGCSSVVFSAQTGLKLDGIDFFLDELIISGSEIVSLPAWFKTFVRLRILRLDGCKQLQEILELPAILEVISAQRCVSLKSFPQISRENQFNTSRLPSLEWINLTDCYKMADKIANETEDFVLDKVHYKDSFPSGIIFPGNKIPYWFHHRMDCPMGSRTCIMDIRELPHLDEIQGIVFCAVLESFSESIEDDAVFMMRNRGRNIDIKRYFISMESKNVWYEYFFKESFELKGDRLQVRLVTNLYLTIRSFGVHIIHKHEKNANDHPDMSYVNSSFFFDGINIDWEISSIEDELDEECECSVGSIAEDESDEERLELSECAKMAKKIGNDQVEDFLLEQVHSKASCAQGIFPGNRIPDWFLHPMKCQIGTSNLCIMNIKGLPPLDEILIRGIAFCAVLESHRAASPHDCVHFAKFTVRHKGIEIVQMRHFHYMESKMVWCGCFVRESYELHGDSLQVRLVTDLRLFIRSFGVHIIHKHEENANDHPDMTRVESCFSFQGIDHWEISFPMDESSEESENSVCSIKEIDFKEIERKLDDIGQSKRRRH